MNHWGKEADFEYMFEGDESSGEVIIVFKGKKLPRLRVIAEGDEWKVNEN